MPNFKYTLIDKSGKKKTGTKRASNKDEAIKSIVEEGGVILSVETAYSGRRWIFGRPRMGLQNKMMFVNNLATMVKVGITIIDSLEILISQTKGSTLKKMYNDMIDRIKSGETLANALRHYDYLFSELFINMIATGEKSGNLVSVLEYLNIQLTKEYEMRKKVVSAMIYPAVILSLTLFLAIGIVVFVMPRITKIFGAFDATLPLPTRFLIGLSEFLTENTLLAVFGTLALVAFFVFIFRAKFMKPFWHNVIVRIPVFGKIFVFSNVARFARSFSSLLQAGLPAVESLEIVGNMMDNLLFKKVIMDATAKVREGGKIGESFEGRELLFPILVSKLLFIGETTGTLEMTTKRIAELYEKQVDAKTKNLSVLMEPLLLVAMSTLVGGIALSIILPIYQLPNLLGQ